MADTERRMHEARFANISTRELNQTQRLALVDIERFGWELKFIRRPLFQPVLPIVFDPDRTHFAVLQEDGTLNEAPGFDIRK